MIAIISPAKTLDFEPLADIETTQPTFKKQAQEIISVLKKKDHLEVKNLMSLSDALTDLNVNRYQKFKKNHTEKNSKAALYAFKGEVYVGLDAPTLSSDAVTFAKEHLRILSGLYGLLRPLDKIQPYRLEMGTKLAIGQHKNLYQYWGKTIAQQLNRDLKKQGDRLLINLASQEYFKSVDKKALKAKVIDVEFLDFHQGEFKVISFFAKKARGLMSRYMLENQSSTPDQLKEFSGEGYIYDANRSNEDQIVFIRQKQ